ncbi:zinc ribbon domain-containing protein [Rhodococcus sp. HM1]|uniref:Zn-ribbon domain-containing OB-fold protein n=1 Tax=Rhodococcus sp. HM1 TaxID=2937759 RepID=UPI00200B8C39|nr:zinc ribbon domain-containing protein [Rhodococcus sp. HM1]MCK8673200.1 zinc ribbon domain-containing protein [Rhodococcus sp. HM1]
MTSTIWTHGRRVPGITPDTADYWTGGATGRLRIQHCSACEQWQHPPSPVCRRCRTATHLASDAVSGHGRVASWTTNEQPWFPGQPVPFRVGYVELVEQPGLYVFGGLIGGADIDDPTDKPVVTRFQQQGEAWLPVFEITDEE